MPNMQHEFGIIIVLMYYFIVYFPCCIKFKIHVLKQTCPSMTGQYETSLPMKDHGYLQKNLQIINKMISRCCILHPLPYLQEYSYNLNFKQLSRRPTNADFSTNERPENFMNYRIINNLISRRCILVQNSARNLYLKCQSTRQSWFCRMIIPTGSIQEFLYMI